MFPGINKSVKQMDINKIFQEYMKNSLKQKVSKIKVQYEDIEREFQIDLRKNNSYQIGDKKFFHFNFFFTLGSDNINFKFYIDPKKGQCIKDVLSALKLYRAFLMRSIKINGVDLFKQEFKEQQIPLYDVKDLNITINFWDKMYAIEQALNKSFKPAIALEKYDNLWLERLYRCLVEKKPYKTKIDKIDDLNVTTSNSKSFDKAIGKDGLSFTIVGDKKLSFCGEKIELYEAVGLFNMQLVSYKVVAKDKGSEIVSLKVKPSTNDKIFESTMLLSSFDEAKQYIKDHIKDLESAKSLITD